MELVVLGASAMHPGAGQACSGYLVKDGKNSLLIDCGTGVLSNLFRWIDPATLDALIISHLHVDHFLDIYPLRYYLQHGQTGRSEPLRVIAPEGALSFIGQLVSEAGQKDLKGVFRFEEIKSGRSFDINELSLVFFEVPHFVTTYGMTVHGSKKMAYLSDCSLSPVLSQMASGADLLIAEATFTAREKENPPGHLNPGQAAEIAKKARAKKLLLTHFWIKTDREEALAEARKIFSGEVLIAKENLKIHL